VRLYISADMEGTAAVCSWQQCDPDNLTEYPYYRHLMSLEVRAAIEGAREAGVTQVLVNDSHSSMRNVLWNELPQDVRMIYGNRKPLSMTQGLGSDFAAAFFTGYHAPAGERDDAHAEEDRGHVGGDDQRQRRDHDGAGWHQRARCDALGPMVAAECDAEAEQ